MTRPDGYLLDRKADPVRILAEVARGFRVTPEEILGRSQTRHIAIARMTAMAVVRQATSLSYPAIGRLFDRDHATVISGVAKVMGDPDLARGVAEVVDELSPPPRLFAVPDLSDEAI